MAAWSLSVFLVASLLGLVLADPRVTFLENIRRDNRIVSGWEAKEGQIPYQLSLRMVNENGGVSSCGGTIIHPEWGLTAAHCLATRLSFVIRTGTVNLTRPVDIFETTEYYTYPSYNEEMQWLVQPNDIGLIKFNRVIKFSALVQPIRLQSSEDMNKDYDGIRLQASGWGRTWTGGESPENLNWVYLNGVSNAFCRRFFGGIIVSSAICASGYNVTSQSICQGDSGGPLVVVGDDGLPTQVGISSFVSGTGCHTDYPAGFIRPGHYHDWYKAVTGYDFDFVPKPSTTQKPETEATTTAEPKTEATTTAEPEPEATTTAEPEPETTTTEEPEPEVTTTEEPEIETTTTSSEDSESTTQEGELITTENPPDEETSTNEQKTQSLWGSFLGWAF
ncbi:collagenase-like [Battus philenor]|uniref:collagenase-like n=1 Tax=Battus philenor TaxID=42288 RepID=UPI0035CF7DF4